MQHGPASKSLTAGGDPNDFPVPLDSLAPRTSRTVTVLTANRPDDLSEAAFTVSANGGRARARSEAPE